MPNSNSTAGAAADSEQKAKVTTSSPNNANPTVSGSLIIADGKLMAQMQIEKKRKERDTLLLLWNRVEQLNDDIGLSTETYKEIQAKVSSKIAQCDRSIQDHKRCL